MGCPGLGPRTAASRPSLPPPLPPPPTPRHTGSERGRGRERERARSLERFFFFFASYFSLEARQSTCSSPSPPSLHVLLPLALPGPSPPLLEESPPKATKLSRRDTNKTNTPGQPSHRQNFAKAETKKEKLTNLNQPAPRATRGALPRPRATQKAAHRSPRPGSRRRPQPGEQEARTRPP